jgi:hypothetical protein
LTGNRGQASGIREPRSAAAARGKK